MSGGGQDLQAVAQQLQELDSLLDALESEIQTLRNQQTEIDEAVEALRTLDTGSVVQVPLGGGAFVRAAVEDIDEVIVTLGGGYATERSEDEAVSLLEDQQDQLDDRIDGLVEQRSELETETEQLEQRAQQMQAQQMQQLQQQQQQQQRRPDDQ